MHPAIIIETVRSLWTWLWGRYHVPQNVFLVTLTVEYRIRIVLYGTRGREYTLTDR